jgi:pyruvate kinase
MDTITASKSNYQDLSAPENLLTSLTKLRNNIYTEGESIFKDWRSLIHRREFLISAVNLSHYLALRHHDLRALQTALMPWGLSSLGRIEAKVLSNLDAVIYTLETICKNSEEIQIKRPPLRAFFRGDRILQKQIQAVFGLTKTERQVRIMVTMPEQAAHNYQFVLNLLKAGTDCVRINCAHDAPVIWQEMINNVRLAEEETGKKCRICMDLAGPKPRTQEIIKPVIDNRLIPGSLLLLTKSKPQKIKGHSHRLLFQASCSLPEVLEQLNLGDSVCIDDGKISAKVVELKPEGVLLEVIHTPVKGVKLQPDKSLNFPDTLLQLSPLTEKDLQDLDFVAKNADIIGYSFVQSAADIALLQQELAKRLPNPEKIAIMAKVETKKAISNLPEIIVQAAGKQPLAVMIARGDLAVEISYQRLAEMQEEILWLCQAAHIPVIWATQVLENLAKKGIPSRAEITDAAMSERAECVMLNKGPFILEAVSVLDDVLTRMQTHQSKKTPQLRALHSW